MPLLRIPTGTVTFLFSDIEGSTRLWQDQPDAMLRALARHDTLLRSSIEANGGFLVKTTGDGVHAAFASAPDALAAVLSAQRALLGEVWELEKPLRVRMGLHSGTAEERDGDYYGPALNRTARLMAAGHGGQALVSLATQELTRDHLPPGASLRDMGERRLKDLAHPERVFQLLHPALPADFPPLRSLDNPDLPNNLPQQVTSFVGRDKEIAQIKASLAGTRLLTLVGSGGAGKSRLSLQVAVALLDQYFDGAFLVELAPLADPDLVAQTVANALNVKEEAGRPLLTTLTEYLRAKSLLLLLDNCEHVLAAGAALAGALLRHCPGVKILATSREGLGIAGETAYRVPLSLPDPKQPQTAESLSHFEAVQLFIARAVQTQPLFAVTDANAPALASICLRLDGIPLALELAAARARSLSVEDINGKLDQRFRLLTGGSRTALPRQQTLRSLIDWSYDLLSPAERALLRRLSMFAAGWVLGAAEAVCAGADMEDWEVLDALTSLCDKSLVVAEPSETTTRYRLLETVRHYARDRLVESGESATFRDAHLLFFLAQAEALSPQISSPRMRETLDRMEEEIDNFRAALHWSGTAPERAESGLRLALAVTAFMRARGYFTERREQLSRALEASKGVSPGLRARGLFELGCYANTFLEFATARWALEESLAVRQELEDHLGIAETLGALGHLAILQEDYVSARQLSEGCLRLQRELGNRGGIASALSNLGDVAYYQGDFDASRSFAEESLTIKRALGSPFPIYCSLLDLGRMDFEAKDYSAAGARWRECLAIVVEHRLEGSIPWALNALAGLLAAAGTPADAARLWGAAERLYEEGSEPIPVQLRSRRDAQVAAARAAVGDETAFEAAWREGRALTLAQAVALAQRRS